MLWGYAITGIIGIAGTSLGAWLTGKWQTTNLKLSIDADRKRAKFDKKTQLYDSFHSAFHDYFIASTASLGIKEEPGRTLYNQALKNFLEVTDQISMRSPSRVCVLAAELSDLAYRYANERKEDPNLIMPERIDTDRAKLIHEMRKELELDN